MNLKKNINVELFYLHLFPSHYIYFLFTDRHDTDTVKIEKVKVQNSVGLKYKFYKAILKISSFWRGFSQSRKFDSRYTSEEENSRGTLSHHHYLVMWLWQILISQILIHSYVQMSRYFSKSHDPIGMALLTSSWRGVSPGLFSQELYLSNFGDHRPSWSEDNFNFSKKIISR